MPPKMDVTVHSGREAETLSAVSMSLSTGSRRRTDPVG